MPGRSTPTFVSRLNDENFALTSRQSFFLWVVAPQFSQAPFLNFVATLSLVPRLYHSPVEANSSSSFCGRWCLRDGLNKR